MPYQVKQMAARAQCKLILLLVLALSAPCVARAQSGSASVIIAGSVSETVALSYPQDAVASSDRVRITSSANPDRTLTLTLSGSARDLTEVRIPIQIRSNTSYRLFAAARTNGSNLSSLLLVDARPTGNLVTADGVAALSVAGIFDARRSANHLISDSCFNHPNLSSFVELLSGPRASLGGTMASQQNAVEVTLSLAIEPNAGNQEWTIELLLSASPGAR